MFSDLMTKIDFSSDRLRVLGFSSYDHTEKRNILIRDSAAATIGENGKPINDHFCKSLEQQH